MKKTNKTAMYDYIKAVPWQSSSDIATFFGKNIEYMSCALYRMMKLGFLTRRPLIVRTPFGTRTSFEWQATDKSPSTDAGTSQKSRKLREFLRKNYATMPMKQIMAAFPGFSDKAIREQARRMGLQRDQALLTEIRRKAGALAAMKNAKPDDDMQQRVERRAAPFRDDWIVANALRNATPLESAWMGR